MKNTFTVSHGMTLQWTSTLNLEVSCNCSVSFVAYPTHSIKFQGIETIGARSETYLTPEKDLYYWPPFMIHPFTDNPVKETWTDIYLYDSAVQDIWSITPAFPSSLLPLESPTAVHKAP